jgi:protein-S-isoprenylcysteine O-methyltransferase Ste14
MYLGFAACLENTQYGGQIIRKNTFYFSEPSSSPISNGPYRFSRNPGYVSLALLHGAVALSVNSLWVLIMLVPAMIVLTIGVIKREERYLKSKFG